jgi:hypothetical protein
VTVHERSVASVSSEHMVQRSKTGNPFRIYIYKKLRLIEIWMEKLNRRNFPL